MAWDNPCVTKSFSFSLLLSLFHAGNLPIHLPFQATFREE